MCGVYGGDNRKYDSYVLGYKTINIPRFKHKKKPISIIKALEVRDKMNRKKIFYTSKTWEEIRKDHFKNTIFLGEEGSSDIGLQSNHPLPD
ncbi:hypothetical protein [Lactococcus lactis]|uniref:Uncharacterized protein n=2 Tax=Lactococcus lactis TaxID=1358 RepID=A0AAW5TMH9_9LACT|nr:hypothetical protein [Lactococcus lactis]MCW2279886.1 hypothetical protein [Lactococcus lactis]